MRAMLRACLILTSAIGLIGCDKSPTEPSPTEPLSAAATPVLGELEPFHISGVVMDEEGRPLAGATVIMNYIVGEGFHVKWTEVLADARGRYQMDIEAMRNGYRVAGLTDIVGFGYVKVDSTVYESDLRFVTSSSSTAVGDFRLDRRVRLAPVRIGRGAFGLRDSATVTFRPDDSVCNGDASLGWSDLCRYVRVLVPADGTLTVTATPSNGGAVPYLLVIDDPISNSNACPCGSGTVSYPVKAGTESRIAMNIPRGFMDHRAYAITTAFRADAK